jgi:drug/metabolite transporter (DMT)-like permease
LLSAVVVREKITAPLIFGGLLVFAATFLVTVYEERKRMRNAALQQKEEA